MQHALRRTTVILASSAVVVAGAPLIGSAFADTVLTQSSVTPANSASVKDSHPTISASYTDNSVAANLDPSSTITVSKGGTASIGCTGVVSGNTITCNYTGLLTAGSYSIVVHAVEAANTTKTADNTTTFTVDVPTRSTSSPSTNALVGSFSSVQVTFTDSDNTIDDAHSTISVQQIADRQDDGTYAPASHTPLTGTTTFTVGQNGDPSPPLLLGGDSNANDTIVFTPSGTPVNKGIYQVTLDVFGTNNDGDGTTKANTENPKAETKDSYTFTLDNTPPPAPTNLSAPTITSANQSAVPFTGKAKPGNTIVVDVTDNVGGTPKHVNNSGTSNGGPVQVQACDSATSCPWTVTLNVSNNGIVDTASGSWTATASNGVGSTASGPVAIIKDTTPPANPTVTGSFSPSNSTTLHVTGGSDSTVDHYTLDIHDGASPNHTIPTITLDKTANGGVAANGTFVKDVDVSSLDDGSITMSIVAYDQLGNHTAIPATGAATSSATKAVGLVLDFDSSFFKQVNLDTPSFPDVLARPNHVVQKLSQIAVEFSNPLTLNQDDQTVVPNGDSSFTAPNPYFVEILPNGADGNRFDGTSTIGTDNRQLLVTPPAGLADGTYKLHVTAYQGPNHCEFDSTPPPAGPGESQSDCNAYDDWVKVPNTSTPFTFTVDTQAPSAPTVTTIPAGTIDGSNVGDVEVKGTGEAGSTLTLTAKSNGGGSVLALNQGQPVTVGDDGKWSDDEDNAALAVLPDGTLTISATPTDAAGNTGTIGTGTVTLAARPSIPRSLAVSQTESSFTLHWVAPSYDGFAPLNGNATSHLTGYKYTYQDTTNGAVDSSLHTVTVSNAAATSATQAGLLAGHTYAVTLCALNGVSGPCNTVNTTATPAYFTALTAKVSKALVVYGNPITLSGRLTRSDIGAGIANAPVKVTPRFDNGTTGTVIHLTTNSLGNWTVTISKPSKNALYVVSFNDTHADPTYQPSNASVRSLVAVSLRIDKVTSKSSLHTYPVTISGHISPNQSGRSVAIYARSASATKYQRIGYAKISSKSTWSFTKTFAKGKYYLYANFISQNGNVGGHSQTVTFTRS